jgi:UDP:flavonoid glycosyltransferase YjiC (YdhE family)
LAMAVVKKSATAIHHGRYLTTVQCVYANSCKL